MLAYNNSSNSNNIIDNNAVKLVAEIGMTYRINTYIHTANIHIHIHTYIQYIYTANKHKNVHSIHIFFIAFTYIHIYIHI